MVHYEHADDNDDHPDRFVNKVPQPLALPEAVWINKPERETESEVLLH